MITIDAALCDKQLLGAALGDLEPWLVWRAVLKASFGLELTAEELALFQSVAGDREPPKKRVRELWAVVGRRGGKSRMAAALAVFIACFTKHKLAAGEVGHVLVLAASRDQARVVFNYMLGFLEASPVLRQEIANITQTEITLRNGIVLGTHANSFKTIRGRTLLAVIFDEISSWRDELSATPDIEVYRAVLPSLMTTNGMLIAISTPYRKTGLLYTKHRDHFGENGDDIVVFQGASTAFNPTLSQVQIDADIADDPEGATSEWAATFRIDRSAFLDDATIDQCIDHSRPLELAYASGFQFKAFTDVSGGRHDSYTLCIGHKSKTRGGSFVADVIRGTRAPFDPKEVTRQYAALLKAYGIGKVTGDHYSGDWCVNAFAENGITYEASERNKSEIYLEALPLFSHGVISFPNIPALIRELRLLERQTHRGGRDTVDHPKRGSDDLANALCGCAAITLGQPSGADFLRGLMGDNWRDEVKQAQRQEMNWMHRYYGRRYPV